jgi:hypothetical protein
MSQRRLRSRHYSASSFTNIESMLGALPSDADMRSIYPWLESEAHASRIRAPEEQITV